jgi:hypothetical protein
MSQRARNNGELHSLYGGQAVEQMFQNLTEYHANEINKIREDEMACSAGLVVSADGFYHKRFTSRGVGTKKWKIPPGGVARFVVTLRTPDRQDLKSDMSSFIATGLMLETPGQAFPVILSYSVLLGQLHLVPSLSTQIANATSNKPQSPDHSMSLQIPMTIRDTIDLSDYLHSKGVPISIESSFSKEIFIGEILSCNRWFAFTRSPKHLVNTHSSSKFLSNYLSVKAMNKSLVDSPTVITVGEVHSTMSCLDASGGASFFSCALLWLQERDKIQPSGCGLTDEEIFSSLSKTGSKEPGKSVKQMIGDATDILISAVAYLQTQKGASYFIGLLSICDTSMLTLFPFFTSAGGYVMPNDLNIIQKARDAWDTVSSYGLNVVTGHLTAFSAYLDGEFSSSGDNGGENDMNTTGTKYILAEIMNNHSNLLSVPVSSILLKSNLDLPSLFSGNRESSFGVVEFDSVYVAQTSTQYIPVSNPTGMSIRVQLSAAASGSDSEKDLFMGTKEFMQTAATDRHPWWTGESYWMSAKDGQIIGAPHNVTFTSGAGSTVNLVQPSLQTISAFVLGCGTRCGKRSDVENSGNDLLYSTIGSGSGSQSTLLGHPWHLTGKPPQPPAKFNTIDPQPFSVGHSGVQEIVLPPYGKAKLGPVFFRPTRRGAFNTSIFISNNLTGFEEVKLRGRGTWEKLAFLDNDDETNGGDIEFRNGRSALVFSGSTMSGNEPVVKSFVLANLGDVAVTIESVSMRSSEIKHFSHRGAYPTSRPGGFWGFFNPSNRDHGHFRCSNAHFHLVGCEDMEPPKAWLRTLFPWFQPPVLQAVSDTNITSFQNNFTLHPNENMTFFVEHRPDCVLRASYASVIFDISRQGVPMGKDQSLNTFRRNKLELLVGYSMNPYAYCIPYTKPASKAFEKIVSIATSSHVLSILSLGFIRRKDEQGTHFIQYEVEVSYVAALFILLLLLLAVDLYGSTEISSENDHQNTSWNQTLRCLARADPVSADLVALGKEQTKHVLLSRFRKENVMATNCVLSDGSFSRDKPGGEAGASSAPHRRMSSSHQQGKTFSDTVFYRHNLLANESKSEDLDPDSNSAGILPCGIAWRTAARRGISVTRSGASASSVEPQYLARTRGVLLQKKLLQSLARTMQPVTTMTLPAPSGDSNGISDNTISNEHTRPPQDQQRSTTDLDKTTKALPVNNEPAKDPSQTLPNEIESANSPKITNRRIPEKVSAGIKETIPIITKPLMQTDQKIKHSDSVNDTHPASDAQQQRNERQKRYVALLFFFNLCYLSCHHNNNFWSIIIKAREDKGHQTGTKQKAATFQTSHRRNTYQTRNKWQRHEQSFSLFNTK